MPPAEKRLERHLRFVYRDAAAPLVAALLPELEAFQKTHPHLQGTTEALDLEPGEAMLIAYGDHVREPGRPALESLAAFMARWLDWIPDLHLLPIHPYSSDDGFSVIDYRKVREDLGGWGEVRALAASRRLMLDAVINHASSQGVWFAKFLRGEPPFERFFLEDPGFDTSRVVRPRTSPLFTEIAGRRMWTTFGPDQVDLDYRNPEVFREILRLLLFYVDQGATFLRLDAVGFLWKAPGRPSIHEPETHALIKAFRAALDIAAPQVKLVSETNVPHRENVAYFGDGFDEAQLVYNFALPPLVLDAYARGDARRLALWAAELKTPSPRTAFLNFLASHDGIGLRPAEGIIPEADVARLVERARAHGGEVSYRQAEKAEVPYELNLTWWDALNPPGEDESTALKRHLGSHLIMLSLPGLPAIYFQSLLGAGSWREGYRKSGIKRRLNRQKFDHKALEAALSNPEHRFARVHRGLSRLLTQFRPAPNAPHTVFELDPRVFAVWRDGFLALVNVSPETVALPGVLGEGKGLGPYDFAVLKP